MSTYQRIILYVIVGLSLSCAVLFVSNQKSFVLDEKSQKKVEVTLSRDLTQSTEIFFGVLSLKNGLFTVRDVAGIDHACKEMSTTIVYKSVEDKLIKVGDIVRTWSNLSATSTLMVYRGIRMDEYVETLPGIAKSSGIIGEVLSVEGGDVFIQTINNTHIKFNLESVSHINISNISKSEIANRGLTEARMECVQHGDSLEATLISIFL